MRRLAAPMLGGLFTSFLMELLIYPIIFFVAKSLLLNREAAATGPRGGFPVVATHGGNGNESDQGEESHD